MFFWNLRLIQKRSKNNQVHSEEEKNVKALPEKNNYYETIAIVEKIFLVPCQALRGRFTACRGSCSLLLISAQVLGRIVLR